MKQFYLFLCSVKKKKDIKNPKVAKTNKGKLIILSKCAVCDSKEWDLLKSKKLMDYQWK